MRWSSSGRAPARAGKGGKPPVPSASGPEAAGVEHFYVENDQSPAPYLPDITTSFAALKRLRP